MTAHRRRGRPTHPDVLTPAEWGVVDLVRHGLSRRQIAQRRGTGEDAVKYHLANIAGKLGVDDIRQLRHWPGLPATRASPRRQKLEDHMTATTQTALGPIGQVSLSIRDVARAERFYGETLGLPHHFTFGDLAFFDAGGVRLYLHRKDEADWQPGSIIYFLCDDIGQWHGQLSERGVHFTGAPHLIYTDDTTGVEEWMAFFEDGEGNTLALMSRVTPSS
ncbi:MAG TPA: VOC family protein [Candidatus Limnocylindria bacterium]|nr:VOC family protein [Candidatus Limnocylindria bacterium]